MLWIFVDVIERSGETKIADFHSTLLIDQDIRWLKTSLYRRDPLLFVEALLSYPDVSRWPSEDISLLSAVDTSRSACEYL